MDPDTDTTDEEYDDAPENRANVLSKLSCRQDDINLMNEALAAATIPESWNYVEDILQESLIRSILQRAVKVVAHLLDRGADLSIVRIQDIAKGKSNEPEPKQKSIELFNCLITHGGQLINIDPDRPNDCPILWHVFNSPSLLQWCLDNDSSLAIPGETTSTDPYLAEIYHTPRRPLLLEKVAREGTISTFRMLLARGARLTPGLTWPSMQAPQVLDQAVHAAIISSPEIGAEASPFHKEQLNMIKYLLEEVGLEVDGGRPMGEPPLIMFQYGQERIYPDSRLSRKNSRDFLELVKILLDAGADLSNISKDENGYGPVTPLAHIHWYQPQEFWQAVTLWQSRQCQGDDRTTKQIGSRQNTVSILSNLPSEIVHEIGLYLDLKSIQSMRLVSRSISARVDQAFQLHIRRRKVFMDFEHLTSLNRELLAGGLTCRVEEAVMIDSDPRNPTVSYRYALDTFMKVATSQGSLCSLDIRKIANYTLQAILHSIYESKIPIQNLSFFHGEGRDCLPIDSYRGFSRLQDLLPMLHKTKSFRWSLTCKNTMGRLTLHDSEIENVETIKKILGMMPQLEVLDLLWFTKPPNQGMEPFFFDLCYQAILDMKRLKTCVLAGIYAEEVCLHQFLTMTSVKHITLKETTLHTGKWRSILDTLTSGSFEYFHLDDLYEQKSPRLCFKTTGPGKTATFEGPHGPSEIVREGREATRRLEYSYTAQAVSSQWSTKEYYRVRRETYGR